MPRLGTTYNLSPSRFRDADFTRSHWDVFKATQFSELAKGPAEWVSRKYNEWRGNNGAAGSLDMVNPEDTDKFFLDLAGTTREAIEREGFGIPSFDEPQSRASLQDHAVSWYNELRRSRAIAAAPEGWTGTMAALGGTMVGAMRDPVQAASMLLVPGFAPARAIQMTRKLGSAHRARLLMGAVEGGVSNLAVEPFYYFQEKHLGVNEYGFQQAFTNVSLGFAMGAGFRWTGGTLRDVAVKHRVIEGRTLTQQAKLADYLDRVKENGRFGLDSAGEINTRLLGREADTILRTAMGAAMQRGAPGWIPDADMGLDFLSDAVMDLADGYTGRTFEIHRDLVALDILADSGVISRSEAEQAAAAVVRKFDNAPDNEQFVFAGKRAERDVDEDFKEVFGDLGVDDIADLAPEALEVPDADTQAILKEGGHVKALEEASARLDNISSDEVVAAADVGITCLFGNSAPVSKPKVAKGEVPAPPPPSTRVSAPSPVGKHTKGALADLQQERKHPLEDATWIPGYLRPTAEQRAKAQEVAERHAIRQLEIEEEAEFREAERQGWLADVRRRRQESENERIKGGLEKLSAHHKKLAKLRGEQPEAVREDLDLPAGSITSYREYDARVRQAAKGQIGPRTYEQTGAHKAPDPRAPLGDQSTSRTPAAGKAFFKERAERAAELAPELKALREHEFPNIAGHDPKNPPRTPEQVEYERMRQEYLDATPRAEAAWRRSLIWDPEKEEYVSPPAPRPYGSDERAAWASLSDEEKAARAKAAAERPPEEPDVDATMPPSQPMTQPMPGSSSNIIERSYTDPTTGRKVTERFQGVTDDPEPPTATVPTVKVGPTEVREDLFHKYGWDLDSHDFSDLELQLEDIDFELSRDLIAFLETKGIVVPEYQQLIKDIDAGTDPAGSLTRLEEFINTPPPPPEYRPIPHGIKDREEWKKAVADVKKWNSRERGRIRGYFDTLSQIEEYLGSYRERRDFSMLEATTSYLGEQKRFVDSDSGDLFWDVKANDADAVDAPDIDNPQVPEADDYSWDRKRDTATEQDEDFKERTKDIGEGQDDVSQLELEAEKLLKEAKQLEREAEELERDGD